MARLWDEYGVWILAFAGLIYAYTLQAGLLGVFLAFNMTLTLASTAAWMMDWFRPVRVWLPRLSRWVARCFAAFAPTAGLLYLGALDSSRTSEGPLRLAAAGGIIAAVLCLGMNVQAETPSRRRHRP